MCVLGGVRIESTQLTPLALDVATDSGGNEPLSNIIQVDAHPFGKVLTGCAVLFLAMLPTSGLDMGMPSYGTCTKGSTPFA